ncbi:glycogen debranching protein GlgX [Alteromonas oceanisediminis]|uniref:glycogen debranching protein GlgX n=1 Tax=Alteromonas oceanisediminis TaxID=2836180 RepID=UPI001BDA9306|nr:glycogen debranching protein GlgX [Alteromonas oceanisediminis]MBT0586553.1 glycogen debranching protein GlgX [Alteromonas oceanisediminis]
MQNSPLIVTPGSPVPLGASVDEGRCNFAVFAPDTDGVTVCLYHPDTEEELATVDMVGRSGPVRHVAIEGIEEGQLYGFRVKSTHPDVTEQKLLIDPYARKLNRACHWNAQQYEGDSQFMLPKGVVALPTKAPPRKRLDKRAPRIIYEAHVKGISKLHPDVPAHLQGTYLGAAHPSILQHLKQLGVTTVQFLPLASFMPEPYITEKGLTNYWGYNPINFFAVEPRYAYQNALEECQQMVQRYHDAGLEVIVDVVFNHTAEGGDGGVVLSFKGLCPNHAYLYEQQANGKKSFFNHSGCGNSFNVANPHMLTLVLDALRHWVTVIGVDGFRFDLAASLGRDPLTFTAQAGFFRALQQDPILRDVLLVAEPWDIGLGGYQVGGFPDGWRECNDKFRDTVRAFWRGDKGLTSDLATRLMGSRDLFHKGVRPVTTSVNPLTYHDGFSLQDLVSYAEKHNAANLEENRDGHSHNLSANYGVEGFTTDAKIIALRERQKRNLFATLMLSQGTPHVLGGDELSRSKQGNNNTYCQDNELNWLGWNLNSTQQDFLDFCKDIIALRNSSFLLQQLHMADDPYYATANVAAIRWYKPDGSKKAPQDWHEMENQAFALEIRGGACDTQPTERAEHWLICVNASDDDVRFSLPMLSMNGGWTLRLDTRYARLSAQPKVCVKQLFLQAGKSIAIFTYSY